MNKKLIFILALTLILSLGIVAATPTQTSSFPNINIEYGDGYGFNLDNFYSGYDTITVNYADPFASTSVQLSTSLVMSTVDDQSFDNGEVAVTLYDFSDFIFFQIDTENIAASQSTYSTTVTITAEDGTGSISDTFTITVTEPSLPNPTQTGSLGDINIEGVEQETISFNDLFSDYDDITVTFTDPDTTLQESITATRGTTDVDGYTTSNIGFQIYATSTNVFMSVIGQNNSWTTTYTVQASNTQGSVSDSATITVTPTTPPTTTPSGDKTFVNADNVGYWKLEDLTDSNPNGNDATNNGATSGVSGQINNAYNFDGTNDYLSIPTQTGYGSDVGSVSFWFYPERLDSTNDAVLYLTDTSLDNRIEFFSRSNTQAYLRLRSGGANYYAATTSYPSSISLNEWQHITMTWDENDNRFVVYHNGQQMVNTSVTWSNGVDFDNLYLGTQSNIANHFDGRIDEVSTFSKALNAEDILYLYNSGNPGSDQQYPFPEDAPPAVLKYPNLTISMIDSDMVYSETLIYPLDYHFDDYVGVTVDFTDPMTSTNVQLSSTKNGTVDAYTSYDGLEPVFTISLTPYENDVHLSIESYIRNQDSITVNVVVDGNNATASDSFNFLINDTLFGIKPKYLGGLESNYDILVGNTFEVYYNNWFSGYNEVSVKIIEENGEEEILDNFQLCCEGLKLEDLYEGTTGNHSMQQANRIGVSSTGYAAVALNDQITYVYTPKKNNTGTTTVQLRVGNDKGYTTHEFTLQNQIPETPEELKDKALVVEMSGTKTETIDLREIYPRLDYDSFEINIDGQTLYANLSQYDNENQTFQNEDIKVVISQKAYTPLVNIYSFNKQSTTNFIVTFDNSYYPENYEWPTLNVSVQTKTRAFDNLIEQTGTIFPDEENLTQSQKWRYVIVTLLILTIGLTALLYQAKIESSIIVYLTIAVNLLLFFYFIIIGYVPVAVLVVIALLIMSLSFLRIKSTMASGGF